MPYAFYKQTKNLGRAYCIANGAQEAFEGRGSLCSELPSNMKDLKLITSFDKTTGTFKYTQVTP